MRILAIRGENLASLSGPFEIDLTTGPLSGTGLFAITGDTGAGKSTILDALCLALYGLYPRAGGGSREDTFDPSGNPMTSGDPRHILRRGAGQGYAEADFTGQDGKSYRARWEVRRARGKPNGALQNAGRRLDLLDGSGSIATGKEAVLEAVETLTGFTFPQFRRTVLLAQGEFDAFLLAPESDRAELLEKITGLDVYTRVSKRVYEETVERERATALLARDRALIPLLDDAAHEALGHESTAATAAIARHTTEYTRLSQQITHAETAASHAVLIEAAAAAHALAHAAHTGAGPERARLAEIDAVAPLRPLAGDAQRLATETAHAATAVAAALEALTRSQHADATARSALAAHDRADKAAAGAVTRFQPEWERALLLDEKIAAGRQAQESAEQAAVSADKAAKETAALGDVTNSQLTRARQREHDLAARIKATSAHAPLATDADLIGRTFETRKAINGRLSRAQAETKSAEAAATKLASTIKTGQAELTSAKAKRTALETQISDRRAALAALAPDALAARDARLRDLDHDTALALDLASQHTTATAALDQANSDASAATAAGRDGTARLATANTEQSTLTAARSELTPFADLADATLTERASSLRSTLVPGEPCPVCGALDHPGSGAGSAAADLAHAIRSKRDAIDAGLAAVRATIHDAEVAIAAAKDKHSLASRARDSAEKLLSKLAPQLQTRFASIAQRATAEAIPAPSSAAPDALHALTGHIADARAGLSGHLKQATDLAATLDRLRHDFDAASRTIDGAAEALSAQHEKAGRAQSDLSAATASAAELTAQLDANGRDLAPYLASGGCDPASAVRDPEAPRTLLLELGKAYRQISADHAAQERAIETLNHALTNANLQAATAEKTLAASVANAERQRAAIAPLLATRQTLLGGEPVAQHRKRISDAETAARAALDSARTAAATAATNLSAATAHHTAADMAHIRAQSQLAAANAAFAAAARDLKRTEPEILALLSIPAGTLDAMRKAQSTFAHALSTADTTLATRRRDLDTLLAGKPMPDAAGLPALKNQQAAASSARDALHGRTAEIATQLKAAAAARSQAAALDAKLAHANSGLAIWRDINEAIGQADGAKFRRFAQGVTLNELIALANSQLASFNPRYALKRGSDAGLTLEIVDSDMAGEVRSPRSLSGGERFLVSLALALALSGLEGGRSFVDSLFIDEGFGALDRETLEVAIDALERLQSQGRKVGVITHVDAMVERIGVQVRVEKRGGGRSTVRVIDAVARAAGSAK